MDIATFCRERCRAKCCYLRLPDEGEIPCPQLTDNKTCRVYHERYEGSGKDQDVVVVGYWKSRKYKNLDRTPAIRPFWCGRIEQIHAQGGLPKEVADGCAVIHPELLEQQEG